MLAFRELSLAVTLAKSAKTCFSDYDIEWLPGGTGGGGDGDEYPRHQQRRPKRPGLGTDGGLRVEPADLLSDNEGQQLRVAADDGKLHMGRIATEVPQDSEGSIGDVVFGLVRDE